MRKSKVRIGRLVEYEDSHYRIGGILEGGRIILVMKGKDSITVDRKDLKVVKRDWENDESIGQRFFEWIFRGIFKSM